MSMATELIDRLAHLAQPWASLYGDSRTLQTSVTFLHVAGIFLGGGFAMATDRETFIALRDARLSGQIRHLTHLHAIHRPVLLGLVIALGSGFLLFAADLETFARSPVFWVKMVLLGLLLGNGYLLARMTRIHRDPVPSVRKTSPTVPVAVDQAISRALAKSAAERFATMDEFAAALPGRGMEPTPAA
jgi:hypothetical protein